jgi:hypothetical protein
MAELAKMDLMAGADERGLRVTMQMPASVVRRLHGVAAMKAMPFTVLARLWVAERLREEEVRLGIDPDRERGGLGRE